MISTYTTFYSDNPQWFNYSTSSSNIQIWGTPSYVVESDNVPIYEVGQTLLYVGYMIRAKKIATHKIAYITDEGYGIKSKYEGNEDYILDFKKTHNEEEWMELEAGMDKYPDIWLVSTHNGPEMYKKT